MVVALRGRCEGHFRKRVCGWYEVGRGGCEADSMFKDGGTRGVVRGWFGEWYGEWYGGRCAGTR